ncbi:glycosyl transferase family 8 [Ferrimonas balearica DSM 9799]|uniref:Glycosyl transferase family 8 n=1 Tax=Ferrimonas balearica (strain DSM 9799 / CCM 4581 / KCTC 23876 / PAT) TaxID=550540 RepID=E1SW53_FERBD|nr:glycosyltransferase family 8 protein [Ferrimonas balearica]ADN74353.1 glycosyl transferase family 8 [Ferrimonas balearica DSM 9799]MBW3141224.1 glycosyltransferase family 8 protein [Ferrimonas balearica]MBW3166083.1 glycosyltransferase family 8 protein [Ferrimonas balearica]MBY6108257.1 glycosyltransferase family 8 protein [Ferrimonas balearica]MBY6225607.1 glycosyltransferase family 8 protein [Ferrimonas balearica]
MTHPQMNIVLSGDDNYSKYMAVTMQNIVHFLAPGTKVNFLILDSGIRPESKAKLQQFADTLDQVQIHIFDIVEHYADELAKLAPYRHGSKKNTITAGTYGLFFVAEAFPEFDKALYIDVDVIVRQNLQPAFDTDIEDKYGAVVRMLTHAQLGSLKSSRSGKPFPQNFQDLFGKSSENYFNAGVQLLNLKRMREEKVKDQLSDTLTNIPLEVFHTEVNYHNQDIFNAVFAGKVAFLPTRYNCQVKNVNKIKRRFLRLGLDFSEFQPEFENPAIIHYSGRRKPWNDKNLFASELWWDAASRTPFAEEINQKYQQDLSKKLKTAKGLLNWLFDFRLDKNQKHIKLFGITLLRDH